MLSIVMLSSCSLGMKSRILNNQVLYLLCLELVLCGSVTGLIMTCLRFSTLLDLLCSSCIGQDASSFNSCDFDALIHFCWLLFCHG